MTDTSKPRYQHNGCTFLGQDGKADLYYAKQCVGGETLIARFSSEPADYTSGTCFAYGSNPFLLKARQIAQSQGLMQYDLKEALHSMQPHASAALKDELSGHLRASEQGKALMLLATDKVAGAAAVQQLIAAGADAYVARFPDKDRDVVKGWVASELSNAQDWLRRLNLPHAHEMEFAAAVYED